MPLRRLRLRRALRHAFTLLCALSLLLCVAVVGVDVISRRLGELRLGNQFAMNSSGVGSEVTEATCLSLVAAPGRIALEHVRYDHHGPSDDETTPPVVVRTRSWIRNREGAVDGILGMYDAPRYSARSGTGWVDNSVEWTTRSKCRYRALVLPSWLALLVFGALPLRVATTHVRRGLRGTQGRCMSCGYDLRAHAAGGQCPECGAGIGAAAVGISPSPSGRGSG